MNAPPSSAFVAGGYAKALKQFGHVDFYICCHPLSHHPQVVGGCDMCRRILTGTEAVEFRGAAPAALYAFEPDPTGTHHFSPDREPHLAADCTDACVRRWEWVALPGRLATRLPEPSEPKARDAIVQAMRVAQVLAGEYVTLLTAYVEAVPQHAVEAQAHGIALVKAVTQELEKIGKAL